jgi:hypothetical protein
MEEVEEETIGIINGMYELLVSIELPVGMELPVLPVG